MNTFIKDNWVKIVWIEVILVFPIFFLSNFLIAKYQTKDTTNQSANQSAKMEDTTNQPIDRFPATIWSDVGGEVAKVYGDSFLKVNDYNLFDVVEKEGMAVPYIVKAGVFNFSFSSVEGEFLEVLTTTFNNFKIYKKDKLIYGGNDNGSWVSGISNVNYNNKSYYMVETYSGGAHCCVDRYPIVIDGESIKINKLIETGDDGGMDFFEKDGEVYVWMQNSDFAYFLTSYVSSGIMFYPNFYKFDKNTGNFIQVDSEFKEYYKKFIEEQTIIVETFKTIDYSKTAGEIWPVYLSARAIYQLKAGQDREDVMKQFDTDFKIIDEKYPRSGFVDEKLEKIKGYILKNIPS